ncbi:hypothetical protein [Sulfuricurvum sp.]|uniref:hypothetical protein n=1 Tax=Sulfuricurvum sp. TaxID=2025608 RepID=UPI002612DEFB|nr:hypothetical protein [Sulfuricurvum sp.]MDD2267625.1 hypothetical protein [Sulfuricurvum sp.]MDD2783461.1 hypothetical protein [Sulfuricurvum sp.]
MDSNEFEMSLKAVGLSKKEFSELVGMNYNSVVNWNKGDVPSWVPSWVDNYAKSKAFDIMADTVDNIRNKG